MRPLQALHQHLREPADDAEAERGVLGALPAQARAVELRRAHVRHRPGVEMRAVRREEPRPAEDLAVVNRLDHDLAARRDEVPDGDRAVADDVEAVGGVALAEDRLALLEVDVAPAAGDERRGPPPSCRRRTASGRGARQAAVAALFSSCSVFRAATSSVMSIPTGHHVMQRPQPTQPDVSNWSCHVPSLCVSHCR